MVVFCHAVQQQTQVAVALSNLCLATATASRLEFYALVLSPMLNTFFLYEGGRESETE